MPLFKKKNKIGETLSLMYLFDISLENLWRLQRKRLSTLCSKSEMWLNLAKTSFAIHVATAHQKKKYYRLKADEDVVMAAAVIGQK